MSIRTKTTLAFIVSSFIAIGLSIWVLSIQLLQEFKSVELDRAKENQAQVKGALQREITNMETKVSDWSQWDDSYIFIRDLNRKYIESNLNVESLIQLKIHGIIFVRDNAVQYSSLIDADTHEPVALSSDVAEHATASALLAPLQTPLHAQSEVAILDGMPAILSARGIYTSNGDGPSAGKIVFVKYLTPQVVEELRDITKLPFTVTPYTAEAMRDALGEEMLRDESITEKEHIHTISASVIESDLVIRDLTNTPVLYIKLSTPRTIYMQGIQTIRLLVGVGVFWGISLVLVLLYMLDRLVLRRLDNIHAQVRTIGQLKETGHRITQEGHDELGDLTTAINTMLASVEQTGKALREKNADLEASKAAILNILEDERDLEIALKREKEGVERKIAERTRELEGEKARLLASINSLNMGYVLTDIHGEVIASNNLIRSFFLLQENTLTIAALTQRLQPSINLSDLFHRCVTHNVKIREENVSVHGAIFRIHLVPVSLTGETTNQVIGAVLLVEDITEQRILERSKDEFFSIASHELRTPLTAIRGNCALIKEYYTEVLQDKSLAEMINDMHESSVRLIAIVNDFLDTSRLEMKKITFEKRAFSIEDLIRECVLEFKGVTDEQHTVLSIAAESDQPCTVMADRNKTKQVLLNLLSNSLKFTVGGTVQVAVKHNNERHTIEIYVSDNGKGISEEGKRLLFHKFQQAQHDPLTRDMTRGTGLGLYISKLLLEGMNGRIWLVESELHKGTTFAFSLPVAAPGE